MHINKYTFIYLVLLSFYFFPNFLSAQDSFKYQAIVRDNQGNVITEQLVGVQVSIIQLDESMPPVYEEIHSTISSNYGVINLNIGDGIPSLGDFGTINWSLKSFIKIEVDVEGGTNYSFTSTTEILSVPKALYAEKSGSAASKMGLYVTDFGAKGDGIIDDTEAFKTALDSAFVLGAKVFVPNGIYRITETLFIKDGVTLIGEGTGSQPLETPYNGSLIWYDGEEWAFKMIGHNSKIKELVIRDKSNEQAKGGILVEADDRLVEGVHLSEVLISGFTNGTGLELSAINQGGIAYASFNDVRIRHAKIGIHIAEEEGSFVNSNTWNHCQVSGGAFDYGMLVDGGNNNIFVGLIIEPPTSEKGHLMVNFGEIFGTEIRIEGNSQKREMPLISFAEGTKNSILTGIYAGGLTLDKGNNFINMKSGKAIHYKNSSFNKFENPTFFSPDNETVLDWDITGDGVQIEILEPELSKSNNILKLTVPAGIIANIEPSALARPAVKNLPLYDQVNFGFYMKTDNPLVAYTCTNAPQGWTNSNPHSGDNDWEFVGMNAAVNRSTAAIFRAQINNTTGGELVVYLSMPVLTFGNQLPVLEETPLFTSGGKLTGMLTHAMRSSNTDSSGFLTLPLNANYFEIKDTYNIHRINHLVKDRIPRGTVITLLFNHAGVGVTNTRYLNLKSSFNSVENGSLTLISNGNGTWREVNRNN